MSNTLRSLNLGTRGRSATSVVLVGNHSFAGAGSHKRVAQGILLDSPPSSSSCSNINNLKLININVNGNTRTFGTLNITNNSSSNNVLLCFPAGGQNICQFLLCTGFSSISTPIIVFQGQQSNNISSWQNAFPWCYKNVQNDVQYVDSALSYIYGSNIPSNIFLTGLSDGGGFCVLYSNLSSYNNNIKAIAICSSAHYGLTSATNIGSYNSNNIYVNTSSNAIIPKNILLPPPNMPLLIMHGTADTVMPILGQNCTTTNNSIYSSAAQSISSTPNYSLWNELDPTVTTSNTSNNTYTVNFPSYISSIQSLNTLTQSSNKPYPLNSSCGSSSNTCQFNTQVYNNSSNTVLNFIVITGQGHQWAGHTCTNVTPSAANNYLDATYLVLLFLNLPITGYTPTTTIIPPNLLTYNNININPVS
jgi:poly(3-hydroxybutyrate) depolymerase